MKIEILIIFVIGFVGFTAIPHSYAGCAAPLFGFSGPCFDSFRVNHEPLSEKSIMEDLTTNIVTNYDSWQMSNRDWPQYDKELELPAIICTEFVVDGIIQYRMAKWENTFKISSFENHRNDFLCDKWLPPIVFEYDIFWDKSYYLPEDTGILKVTDNEMNLDESTIDVFEVHVWSDIDHKGIQLKVIETDTNTGTFTGKVFLTTDYKSENTQLLVEDAVHAKYKKLHKFSRIGIEEPHNENNSSEKLPQDFTMVLSKYRDYFSSHRSIGFGIYHMETKI